MNKATAATVKQKVAAVPAKAERQRPVRHDEAPPLVQDVIASAGRPLDEETRAFFEPQFGYSFANVRLHTDGRASASAQSVNALAYTVGQDIVFRSGQYNPSTPAGRHLLAHELTHVIQQDMGGGESSSLLPGGSLEQEADQVATAAAGGASVRVEGAGRPGLMRQAESLIKTLNPVQMTDAQLEQEYNLLRTELMQRARRSDPDTDSLVQALTRIEAEAVRRNGMAKKLRNPLIPNVQGASDRDRLINAIRIIQNVKPTGNGMYTVEIDNKTVSVTQKDLDEANARIIGAIKEGLRRTASEAEYAETGYNSQSELDKKHWIVSSAIKFIGNIKDPGPFLRAEVAQSRNLAAAAQEALKVKNYAGAAAFLADSESAAIRAKGMYRMYWEGIISAGEATVTVLEYTRDASFLLLGILATIASAGAAAGLLTAADIGAGGTAAAGAIATWTPFVAQVGEAGVRVAEGDKVDWAKLAIDGIVTAILSKFGGKLGEGVAGRIIGQNPVAQSLGKHIVARIVSSEINGVAAVTFTTVVNSVYAKVRNQNMTWGTFLDQLITELTDPKSQIMNVLLGAIEGYGHGKGAQIKGLPAPHGGGGQEKGGTPPPAGGGSKDTAGSKPPPPPDTAGTSVKDQAPPPPPPAADAVAKQQAPPPPPAADTTIHAPEVKPGAPPPAPNEKLPPPSAVDTPANKPAVDQPPVEKAPATPPPAAEKGTPASKPPPPEAGTPVKDQPPPPPAADVVKDPAPKGQVADTPVTPAAEGDKAAASGKAVTPAEVEQQTKQAKLEAQAKDFQDDLQRAIDRLADAETTTRAAKEIAKLKKELAAEAAKKAKEAQQKAEQAKGTEKAEELVQAAAQAKEDATAAKADSDRAQGELDKAIDAQKVAKKVESESRQLSAIATTEASMPKRQAMADKIDGLKTQRVELEKRIADQQKEVDRAQRKYSEASRQVSNKKGAEREAALAKVHELENDLNKATDVLNPLKEQRAKLNTQIEVAQTELQREIERSTELSEDVKADLRKAAVKDWMRDFVNSAEGDAKFDAKGRPIDPVYNKPVGKLSPDHIYPVSKIEKLPGFNELSRAQQVEVLNLKENLMGIDLAVNESRKDRSWAEYEGLGGKEIDPKVRKELIRREDIAKKIVENAIAERLGNKPPHPDPGGAQGGAAQPQTTTTQKPTP
ncbi:eCIS core domain-containing protein [Puia dinghuensis]|uniref:eCIS core domain-containing protein n=1 Tax=Puia dinghuensis TaxID=1792502 RepID=A0A8J2XRW4_9BACT|nr:DUF4157 domain-containing protein [Puia dinghuensis]GGA88555.1 hypothetical protein GCM10011511_09740 [Puia dinghuensis]